MLTVHSDELAESAARLNAAYEELRRTLMQLERETQLLASAWSGDAQLAYAVAHRSWNASMDELAQLLTASRTMLASSAERYQQTERALERAWTL